ncbi:hypothetical protein [Cohnella panacarvi]|uniref:hypothetical protein n=1 Tax=Cohnella panacarvi TaxID=400776 RepID=UPI00047B5AD3|nr:hypothetical protein [Cohnella panacarvi]
MKATQNPESDQFILGVTGSYDIMADKLGFTYFKMSDEVWDDLVANANRDYDEIWRVNEKFIKEQISAGKEILLSNNPFEQYLFDDGSKRFFQRELDYLTVSGYIFSETSDGMWKATIGLIRSE